MLIILGPSAMVNHSDCRIVCSLSNGCQDAFYIVSFFQAMDTGRFNMRIKKGTHFITATPIHTFGIIVDLLQKYGRARHLLMTRFLCPKLK